jgi:hypothetical protein
MSPRCPKLCSVLRPVNQSVTHPLATDPKLVAVSVWPADLGHRDAIDTLLEMAKSEDRWGEPRRAIDLLDNVERIVGALPQPYERLRSRCRDTAERSLCN